MAVTDKAQVVIVGSGIIGNATAYYLAKRGASVIVLEGSEIIGNGGSSRNGGGVRQSARDPRELPLAMYAVEHMWPTLSEELDMDVEYAKKEISVWARAKRTRRFCRVCATAARRWDWMFGCWMATMCARSTRICRRK